MHKPMPMTEEHEAQKKAIYERMSPRRRKFVDRIGYDRWNPFAEPKEPIEWRTDGTKRTTQQLVREYLQNHAPEKYSNAYGQGVLEMCLGMVNGDERYIGMFEFSKWYAMELQKHNVDINEYKP